MTAGARSERSKNRFISLRRLCICVCGKRVSVSVRVCARTCASVRPLTRGSEPLSVAQNRDRIWTLHCPTRQCNRCISAFFPSLATAWKTKRTLSPNERHPRGERDPQLYGESGHLRGSSNPPMHTYPMSEMNGKPKLAGLPPKVGKKGGECGCCLKPKQCASEAKAYAKHPLFLERERELWVRRKKARKKSQTLSAHLMWWPESTFSKSKSKSSQCLFFSPLNVETFLYIFVYKPTQISKIY